MADEYRISTVVAEVLVGSVSRARVTTLQAEVLRSIAAPAVRTHRFWRLLFPQRNQYVGLTAIKFFSGTTDLTPSGTLTASGTSEGSVSNLADDTASTIWTTNTSGGPGWLQIDFGMGVALEVTSYVLYARPSYSSSDSPRMWTLQSSDDGVNWHDESVIDGQEGWTDNEVRTYDRDYTGWRIVFTGAGTNGYLSFVEFELHDSAGGADLTNITERSRLIGRVFDNGYTLNNAKDGGTGTFYYVQNSQFNTALPPYIGWRFAQDLTIEEVTITVRPDYGSVEGPSEFTLQKSSDSGKTWESVGYVFNIYPWANAEKKTFTIAPADGYTRVSRTGLYTAEGPDGLMIGRAGCYTAEGPDPATFISRGGLYVVEGPPDVPDDTAKLYRRRQYFMN
jgi:hypothetical protein